MQNEIKQLESKYKEILDKHDLNTIFKSDGLSGIFLPCPDESFFTSERKIMIIGQETKSWRTRVAY